MFEPLTTSQHDLVFAFQWQQKSTKGHDCMCKAVALPHSICHMFRSPLGALCQLFVMDQHAKHVLG